MFEFDLGSKVRDSITGFTGVITSRTEWLNGCKRYSVQCKELKDGAPVELVHFDEQQLELVGTTELTDSARSSVGGPMKDDPGICDGE